MFKSTMFRSVVKEGIRFFESTGQLVLPPNESFEGAGVYALYYSGNFKHYRGLSTSPIYVGKAVPTGWRTARSILATSPTLYRRLREHARSIEQTSNLVLRDFNCKFVILTGIEGDLIVPMEAEMIRRYHPIWNSVIDGFGNHNPGSGRYNQAKSEWDVLHPGRGWASRLTGEPPSRKVILSKLKRSFP